MNPQNEIGYLERLVRTAGSELLKYWPGKNNQNNLNDLKITRKTDGSAVTAADYASNKVIVDGLKDYFKGSTIISEELPEEEDIKTESDLVWIIDPLDGTKAFIEGRDDFSILIGLSQKDILTVGIMYFPARDLFAYAVSGNGSKIGNLTGRVSESKTFRDQAVYYRNCSPKPGRYLFTNTMDSGLAFLSLANGELDGIILRMTTHREWDIAAPIVVVEASGGRVSDENGDPIKFKNGKTNCKYIVASNSILHQELLDIVS